MHDSRPVGGCLAGKTILVVGAHGALGSALSRACAAEGATVVLLGRRLPKLNRLYDALLAAGAPTPAIYPLDLEGAGPADYAQLAEAIDSECGGLDAIVHVAAEFKGLAGHATTPPEDWVRALHVNLTAPLLLTQACLGLLRRAPQAAVLVALDDPERIEKAHWGGYALAHAGRAAWVRSLGDELENSPVRVLGFRPGPMRTPLRARAYFAEDPSIWPAAEEVATRLVTLLSQAHEHPAGGIVALTGLAQA